MTRSIRILHVEDDAGFADLTRTYLEREHEQFDVTTVETPDDARERLETDAFDCVVSDYDMPGEDGIALLEDVRDGFEDLPFILFTGKGSEEIAGEAITAGVTDYLQKGGTEQYSILANRISNYVERTRAQHEREEMRRRIHLALEHTDALIFEIDAMTGTITRTGQYERYFDVEPEDVPDWETHLARAVHPDDRDDFEQFYRACLAGERASGRLEYRTNPETGEVRWIRDDVHVEEPGGRVIGLAKDITDQKRRARRRDQIISRTTDAILEVDASWAITLVNEEAASLFDRSEATLLDGELWDLFPETVDPDVEETCREVMETRTARTITAPYDPFDAWFEVQVYPNPDGGLACYFRDVTERVERERRFEAIFNNTYQYTGLLEPDGTVLESNDAGLAFVEREREDVVGGKLWEGDWFQRSGDTAQRVREAVRTAATGEFVHEEMTIEIGEETARIDFSIRPVADDDGEVVLLIPEARDITETHERGREIERTNALLSTLIETLPVGILAVDHHGTVLVTNERVVDLFALPFTVEASAGMDIESIASTMSNTTDDPVRFNDLDEFQRTSEEIQLTDGRSVMQRHRHLALPDGPGSLLVFREITESRHRESQLTRYNDILERLQRTTTRLIEAEDAATANRIVLESIEDVLAFDAVGIWRPNADGTRLDPVEISELGEEIIPDPPSYSAGETSLSWMAYRENEVRVIGDIHDHSDRLNPETPIRSEIIAPLGSYGLINIGATTPEAFTEQDASLVELWAETVTSALMRIERERDLREREGELMRERNRLNEFASFVSHDLRNPLNVAIGRLELATADCETPHHAEIDRALERMDDLIDDLLTLSRSGNRVGDREVVAIVDVARMAWSHISSDAASLDVRATGSIRADRSRLVQAFENLFRNAIEHGPVDVTVTVESGEDAFIVTDDGPGIPEDDRATIFEAGFSTIHDGTGFGLAIVKDVVEAHGWEVEVDAGADGGARFEVSDVTFVEE